MKKVSYSLFLAVVAALALGGKSLQAQSFPSFDQVDYVTVQDFSVFESIWEKADSENVRLALFGDSQETSPGGAGAIYIPRLNFEFYDHFGKVGESFASTGSGSFAGEWLVSGSFGSGVGTSSGSLASNQRLPQQDTRTYTSSALGMNTHIDSFNSRVNEGAQIPATPIWGDADDIHALIFGVTQPGSDELSWRSSPTDGNLQFFLPTTASGTTNMGLDAPAGQILSEQVGPLNSDGFMNRQVIVRGSGSAGAEFAGTRYLNLSTPGGVSVQDFAAGGYLTDSFLTNHADAGPMLHAFGPWDAIIVHTGANDAYSGSGTSAADFRADVLEFINAVRGPNWLDNPTQKFILVTDPFRADGPMSLNQQFDQYAGALADLATGDPFIMAINSRRWTDEIGWNENGSSPFLSDIVHYSAEGARLMALVDSHLMLNGTVLGDFDKDGDVDTNDVDFYAGNLGSEPSGDLSKLDLNNDGQITLADHNELVTKHLRTLDSKAGTVIGDLNLDGTVDVLNDIFVLISNLGTVGGDKTSYAQGDINADQQIDVLNDAFGLISVLSTSRP